MVRLLRMLGPLLIALAILLLLLWAAQRSLMYLPLGTAASPADAGLPEAVRAQLGRPFTGDLDGMVARRMIRVGATFNRTCYFVDNGVQRGLAYEFGRAFEDELNKKLKTGNLDSGAGCG